MHEWYVLPVTERSGHIHNGGNLLSWKEQRRFSPSQRAPTISIMEGKHICEKDNLSFSNLTGANRNLALIPMSGVGCVVPHDRVMSQLRLEDLHKSKWRGSPRTFPVDSRSVP